MPAKRFGLLAHGLALLAFAFASCADRDDAVNPDTSSAGNSCSACAGEATGGNGEGGKGLPEGGTQTVQPGAGTSNQGGTVGAGAGNTPGGAGGGPPDGPVLEELSVCDRLLRVQEKNRAQTDVFERNVYLDCRVKWLPRLYIDAHAAEDYRNALEDWNDRFWGCRDLPVDDFLLVWGTPPISQGDADIVIEHYMVAAIEHLQLTQKEEDEMRAALQRLATVVITSPSLEPSQSGCVDPNGGAGGMDGSGGAAGANDGGQGGAAGATQAQAGNGGSP